MELLSVITSRNEGGVTPCYRTPISATPESSANGSLAMDFSPPEPSLYVGSASNTYRILCTAAKIFKCHNRTDALQRKPAYLIASSARPSRVIGKVSSAFAVLRLMTCSTRVSAQRTAWTRKARKGSRLYRSSNPEAESVESDMDVAREADGRANQLALVAPGATADDAIAWIAVPKPC
jgi:hypothetical protein